MSGEKAQYRRVIDLIEKESPAMVTMMGLDHWEIEHVFLDTFFGDDGEEDFKITAVTETRWEYMQAKIKWFLPSAVRHDDFRLKKTLIHELNHVTLAPEQAIVSDLQEMEALTGEEITAYCDGFSKRIELSTEMMTRALVRAWALTEPL